MERLKEAEAEQQRLQAEHEKALAAAALPKPANSLYSISNIHKYNIFFILEKNSVVTIYGDFSDHNGLMCSNSHWKSENKIGYQYDSYDHYYRQMNWERTTPIIGNKKADKTKLSALA